jgi:hypothetical protein
MEEVVEYVNITEGFNILLWKVDETRQKTIKDIGELSNAINHQDLVVIYLFDINKTFSLKPNTHSSQVPM